MPEWAFESPSDGCGLFSPFLCTMILASLSPCSKPSMLHIRFPKPRGNPTNLEDWLAFAFAVLFVRNALPTFLNQSPIYPPKFNSTHPFIYAYLCASHCALLLEKYLIYLISHFCGFLLYASTVILYLHTNIYHLWETVTRFSLL